MSVQILSILVCCSCFSITVILIVSNDILNYFGIKDKKNKDKKDKKNKDKKDKKNLVKKIKNAKNKRNKSIKRGCRTSKFKIKFEASF